MPLWELLNPVKKSQLPRRAQNWGLYENGYEEKFHFTHIILSSNLSQLQEKFKRILSSYSFSSRSEINVFIQFPLIFRLLLKSTVSASAHPECWGNLHSWNAWEQLKIKGDCSQQLSHGWQHLGYRSLISAACADLSSCCRYHQSAWLLSAISALSRWLGSARLGADVQSRHFSSKKEGGNKWTECPVTSEHISCEMEQVALTTLHGSVELWIGI